MEKFKDDEIDKEFFRNDFWIDQLERLDDLERYKSDARNTYSYAFYRWNMTILPYKLSIGNWIEASTIKIVDIVRSGISKIIK